MNYLSAINFRWFMQMKELGKAFFNQWLAWALRFFLISSILGLLMRLFFVMELPLLDYKHLLHAHSHLALLGWGFTALSTCLLYLLIKKTSYKLHYQRIMSVQLFSVLGMLLFFVLQGYSAFSIGFSTLHLCCVYFFAWFFLKDLVKQKPSIYKTLSKWAIYWLLISTIGLWSIAPVASILGKLHPLYFASIQFFLHFQLNGWLIFGVLAILFKFLKSKNDVVPFPKTAFIVLQFSLMLTYALSITWSTPESFLFYLNGLGVILQFIAFLMLFTFIRRHYQTNLNFKNISSWLLLAGIISLGLKVIAQTAVAIPYIAEISYTIRNFVIGFIHLTLIGAVSFTLLGILIRSKLLPNDKSADWAYTLFIVGYALTEFLLFYQGLRFWLEQGFIPFYHLTIFIASLLFPVSIFLILTQFNRLKKSNSINS